MDYARLTTPPDDGDVLIEPPVSDWFESARASSAALNRTERRLLGETIGTWRKRTRQSVLGGADRFAVVLGHQPEFIHPGVWAKHVVATRFAAAVDGSATNLVVDSDVPKSLTLAIPRREEHGAQLHHVRFSEAPLGVPFESLRRIDPVAIERFANDVRDAMGDAFDRSHMPAYFAALTRSADAPDWVDQHLGACSAINASLGVCVADRRVSSLGCNPLTIDMMVNAEAFAACYNCALTNYRTENHVRGRQRPIPDLVVTESTCEVPLWAFRMGEPRRRVFVSRSGDPLTIHAQDEPVGQLVRTMRTNDMQFTKALPLENGYQLRPRALALTLWARLLLADLFIHGIGGAKYDRISDTILAEYYGVEPPPIACVSATVTFRPGRRGEAEEQIAAAAASA